MRAVYWMGLCLAATTAVSAAGWAQDRGAPAPAGRSADDRVKAMFDRLDTNHDGYVSREEVNAARDAMRQRMRERRAAARDKAFARLDANGDGSVSRAEFDAAPRVAGGGEGGRRGRAPRRGGGMMGGGMMGAMFDRADTDHDGRVSLAEAQAAARQRQAMRAERRQGGGGAAPEATSARPLGGGR